MTACYIKSADTQNQVHIFRFVTSVVFLEAAAEPRYPAAEPRYPAAEPRYPAAEPRYPADEPRYPDMVRV